jgi:hypothetical protein
LGESFEQDYDVGVCIYRCSDIRRRTHAFTNDFRPPQYA